jgi:hypothetical protein
MQPHPPAAGDAPAKRDMPDFDGRPDPPATLGDTLLWVPRGVLFPVYLTTEYLVRRPVGWVMTTAEREDWPAVVIDFFTFADRRIGIVPTAFFDFGFRPSVGLYLFWNDLFIEGNDIRLTGGYGGDDWRRVTALERLRLGESTELSWSATYWDRPDYQFAGLGFGSRGADVSRFKMSTLEARLGLRYTFWRSSALRWDTLYRQNRFDGDDTAFGGHDPSINQAVAAGLYELPPGFTDGYQMLRTGLRLWVDTRRERPSPGSGIRVEGFGRYAWQLDGAEAEWFEYGGSAAAFFDIAANRVLGVWLRAATIETINDVAVPFTELGELGTEPLLMGGFQRGRLRGTSTLVATLEYRYPVWMWADGTVHISTGNVFSERFANFQSDRLRLSYGIGLRSVGDRDNSLTLLIAVGTFPFAESATIDSVSFQFGTQTGF